MAGETFLREIDLLVDGPTKPIVDNVFPDQFVLIPSRHCLSSQRLTRRVAEKIRGAAVTYNTVRGEQRTLALFLSSNRVSFGASLSNHIDALNAREHNIVVTNTPAS